MLINIVFTLTGKDRIGIVDEITQLLLQHGGNVEMSRMARLGGEFAILMLVSISASQLARLGKGVEKLTSRGYKVTTSQTQLKGLEIRQGWFSYQIEVCGADQEGIIHEISHYLSRQGIHIEMMDTRTTRAPMSGTTLFSMSALIAVPPTLQGQEWQGELRRVSDRLNVEIKVLDVSP